jgi:hypothetical protein
MGAPPIPYLPQAPASMQSTPRGLLGMMIDAGLIDPANPDTPAPGGLPGMLQEWMRNNQNDGANR